MPPKDAENCKLPGIFFSKPCNLFKKLLLVFDSADFCNLALFTLCTAADCHCLFVLLSDADCYYWETKGKPSLVCPWSHCQQTSATFLCFMFCCCMMLIAAACTQLHLQTFYFLWSPPAVCWCCLLIRTTATHITREVRHTHAAFTRCFCELPWKRGDVVGHLGILGTATAITVTFMFYWFFRIAPQGDALQQGTWGVRLYCGGLYRRVDVQLFCTINCPHVKCLFGAFRFARWWRPK